MKRKGDHNTGDKVFHKLHPAKEEQNRKPMKTEQKNKLIYNSAPIRKTKTAWKDQSFQSEETEHISISRNEHCSTNDQYPSP